ncbi:MAG: lantibiotic dehydratase family protein [Myxococcaceae bacterium]|nr:lantibiotic dehydratase family protein [Myxococcaceae bacterium]
MSTPRWKLVPHFLLRRAGFPFALLDEVSMERAGELALGLAAAVAEAEGVRARLLQTQLKAEVARLAPLKDKAALRALSRFRRRLGHRQSVEAPHGPWSPALAASFQALAAAHATVARGREALETESAQALQRVRARLRQHFKRADAREALFLLSPGFLDTTEKKLDEAPTPAPDSHERALERRLYSFLQRLSAKNETTSFFGPLAYGVVREAAGPFSFGPETERGVVKRQAFAAFWAVTALAKAAASDVALRELVTPRRVAVSRAQGQAGVGPDGAAVELTPTAAKVFPHVDGRRTGAALAKAAQVTEAELKEALTFLERKGFVRRDLEPLSTVGDALADLRTRLPDGAPAQKWKDALASFAGRLEAFAQGDLATRRKVQVEAEAQFHQLTGLDARRAGGKMYADRTVLYEDCLGDLQPLSMAPVEAERLERAMSPLLDLGSTYGRLRVDAVKAQAVVVLKANGGKMRFLHFAEVLDGQVAKGVLEPGLAPAKAWLSKLTALVQARTQGNVARLSFDDVAPLIDRTGAGRFASPDVMLEKLPSGEVRFVIGEVHPYVYAWGSQNQFAPDMAALQAAFAKDLSPWGGKAQMATVLRRRRHKGLVSNAFPGSFIEISGRGEDDPEKTLAVADLEVVLDGEQPKLLGLRGPITLYAGEDDHPHLRVFAPAPCEMPPIRIGVRTPRVEIGEAVLQRARWYVEPKEVQGLLHARSVAQVLEAGATLRHRLDLPRHVFAGSPSEPKPMCIDFSAFHAVQLLAKMFEAGPVSLVEMLPGPKGLWLKRQAGEVTTELRTAMIREQ